MTAVYFENLRNTYTHPASAQQIAEFLNVTDNGTYSYHWDLTG
jgi:hypothetical protein